MRGIYLFIYFGWETDLMRVDYQSISLDHFSKKLLIYIPRN